MEKYPEHQHKTITTVLLLLLSSMSLTINAQSELDIEFETHAGGEYNIFKSPEVLRNTANGDSYGMDTILVSDYLFDFGFDLDYARSGTEKSVFEIDSDFWYRHYLNYSQNDQKRFNTDFLYEHALGSRVRAGLIYEFRWSERIGSSVTGDLLMRSFKYIGNTGNVFLTILPGENLTIELSGDYEYKYYYDNNTRDKLDHGNLTVAASAEFSPSRRHELTLDLEFTDRNYSRYHSLDSNGRYDPKHPLRNFRYYEASIDYDLKPVRGFLLSPSFEVRRRIDMYQDYYSYLSFGGGFRIRYMWDRFYISLYGDYNRLAYDIREAFTNEIEDPFLVYDYLDLSFIFRYEISERWEISLRTEVDNRDSNTDLENFRTRRPYENYTALLGLVYTLPVIK